MARPSVRRPRKSVTKPEVNYINGHQVQNKILLALPKREYEAAQAHQRDKRSVGSEGSSHEGKPT
jgi:hypothetical protein